MKLRGSDAAAATIAQPSTHVINAGMVSNSENETAATPINATTNAAR